MWDHTGGWGMGWIGLGMIHMVVFWGVVIFVIVALARLIGGRRESSSDRALDILRERFARGEIDADEYDRVRRELDK